MKVKQFNVIKSVDGVTKKLIITKFDKNKKMNLYDFYEENLEQRCYCEHDCCGHWFSSLGDIKRKGNKIYVSIGYAPNY